MMFVDGTLANFQRADEKQTRPKDSASFSVSFRMFISAALPYS